MLEPQQQTVRVLYTLIPASFGEAEARGLIDHLTIPEQTVYFNKSKPLARHQFLLGRLLIRTLCIECYPGASLSLHLTPFGKPYLEQKPLSGISIAHSNHLVVCALHSGGQVGIDTEFIRPLALESFQAYFLPEEWDFILNHTDSVRLFFELWTRKEAVMKADGRGLGLDLSCIETLSNPVITEVQRWRWTSVFLNKQFATTLAYPQEPIDPLIQIQEIDIAAFRPGKKIPDTV